MHIACIYFELTHFNFSAYLPLFAVSLLRSLAQDGEFVRRGGVNRAEAADVVEAKRNAKLYGRNKRAHAAAAAAGAAPSYEEQEASAAAAAAAEAEAAERAAQVNFNNNTIISIISLKRYDSLDFYVFCNVL